MKFVCDIPIIYEDAGILVVDKPSGLLSQPGLGPERTDSVLSRLRSALTWVELVHRLDRDTSGLLMLSLDPAIHRMMSLAFAERRIQKHYLGVCSGAIQGETGMIVSPLARIGTNPPRYAAHPEGRMAMTQWHCLSRESDHSRLRLIPITGRSHQLRAHLEGIGHPLLGDPIYGNAGDDRLMLHAESLGFTHPVTGLLQELHVPAPF